MLFKIILEFGFFIIVIDMAKIPIDNISDTIINTNLTDDLLVILLSQIY